MKFYRKAMLAIALVFACMVPTTSAVADTVIVCDYCIIIYTPHGTFLICGGCRKAPPAPGPSGPPVPGPPGPGP